MPDITMCTNEDCPLSYSCWRFNCPPSQYFQSYARFEPHEVLDEIECDMYLETPHDQGISPIELEPVLAEINHINELGLSKWYEVVYFDGNWRCYAGSKTFKDGESVIKWKYAKDCF